MNNILLPGKIVIIADQYNESSLVCQVLKPVDLDQEQERYEDSLLTGYTICYNYTCKADYQIDSSNERKFCPYCGDELKPEQKNFPRVFDFVEFLLKKGLVKRYDELSHHNTYY